MAKPGVKAVILAGGQGTRFWPISRVKRPKQFLSISPDGESLIAATARRLIPLVGEENIVVVTNVIHRPLVEEHVPCAKIITEPVGRNTAPSIGLAALLAARQSPETVMISLPADHAVTDETRLRAALSSAAAFAATGDKLVTIGVAPTSPHTGYGYIKQGDEVSPGIREVGRFFEKPSLERAVSYLESGGYLWNSGMFAWRADSILRAIKEYLPEVYAGLMKIDAVVGTAKEQPVLNEVFEQWESVSIDFGVLEHARNCYVVAAEPFGWSDVGSWDAWAQHFRTDEKGNLLHGEALVVDSSNCVVHSERSMTAVIGADDLVVIQAGDALLVCPRTRVQDVRIVVEELKKRGRTDLT